MIFICRISACSSICNTNEILRSRTICALNVSVCVLKCKQSWCCIHDKTYCLTAIGQNYKCRKNFYFFLPASVPLPRPDSFLLLLSPGFAPFRLPSLAPVYFLSTEPVLLFCRLTRTEFISILRSDSL